MIRPPRSGCSRRAWRSFSQVGSPAMARSSKAFVSRPLDGGPDASVDTGARVFSSATAFPPLAFGPVIAGLGQHGRDQGLDPVEVVREVPVLGLHPLPL